jgi:deoxyribodipyrimidine photo-lyase
MGRTILWFRNDLRLADHAAARAAAEHGEVLPVYVWDARWQGTGQFGAARIGAKRAAFVMASLSRLAEELVLCGSHLHVELGHPPEVLARLAQQWGASAIYHNLGTATEEREDERELDLLLIGSEVQRIGCWGHLLFEPDDLPFEAHQVPELFTDFRKRVERTVWVRRPTPPVELPPWPADVPRQPVPTWAELMPDIPEQTTLLPAGEREAQAQLTSYLWTHDRLRSYKNTRNGLLGAEYSSRLSSYLAIGSLSPRQVWSEVKRYEIERVSNESTYWLGFELLWREFFQLQVLKHGGRFFQAMGPKRIDFPWSTDPRLFLAWKQGLTGVPIVDAAMRELADTGLMGNRARQLVASYLTKNLGLDWRMGAEHFEQELIDYDPCSNYGNWCYAAGVGQDARGFRYFHLPKQAAEHDPDGAYVRHWCPELATLPTSKIHAPHLLTADEQRRYGVQLGTHYPLPIVDLDASVKANEQLYITALAAPHLRKGNYRLARARQARNQRGS